MASPHKFMPMSGVQHAFKRTGSAVRHLLFDISVMRQKNSVSEFVDLPLHDSVISSIVLHWAEHRVEILLSVFVEKGQLAKSFRLQFDGVTNVEAPHTAPWGESASINGVTEGAGGYELEMQSGDAIKIEAKRFSFVPITS